MIAARPLAQPLVEQLKPGGRLVIPVGPDPGGSAWGGQELVLLRRSTEGLLREKRMDVRFVPMTGQAQDNGGGQQENCGLQRDTGG